MISVNVRTNTAKVVTSAEITDTPIGTFDALGVDVSTSMVNLNGVLLHGDDMTKSFESLNIADGSEVRLTAVVKADGAF